MTEKELNHRLDELLNQRFIPRPTMSQPFLGGIWLCDSDKRGLKEQILSLITQTGWVPSGVLKENQ